MRDELKKIYEVVLEYEIDDNAEPEDFETNENQQVLEYLQELTRQVKEITDAQVEEDKRFGDDKNE